MNYSRTETHEIPYVTITSTTATTGNDYAGAKLYPLGTGISLGIDVTTNTPKWANGKRQGYATTPYNVKLKGLLPRTDAPKK